MRRPAGRELVAGDGRLPGMRCDDARSALSARLDGEDAGSPADLLDGHLDACPLCQAWLAGAQRVTLTVRSHAVAVPDLTARILAAVQADGSLAGARTRRPAATTGPRIKPSPNPKPSPGLKPSASPRPSRSRAGVQRPAWASAAAWASWSSRWAGMSVTMALRWILGVLAVGQVMLAVPDLFGVVGFGFVAHEAHAGREVAAFDVALAVGLLLVASYPEYARVFAPVVVTLVVCFAAVSALDIMQGVVSPSRVAVHGVAVIQAVLVWWLARAGQNQAVVVHREQGVA